MLQCCAATAAFVLVAALEIDININVIFVMSGAFY